MTVTISGPSLDSTGRKDSRDWQVFSPVNREAPDGGVITMKAQPIRVVGGLFTAELEPGPVVLVNPDGKRYTVTVPNENASLWEVIAAAEAFPPDTAQEALASAVTTFLDENPVVTMQVEGITDAGTVGANVVKADDSTTALTALGGSSSGRTVFTGTAAQARTALGTPGLAATKNVYTGQQEINGGFTNAFKTALWIAPPTELNPTNLTQSLYVQHRIEGDLNAMVHDAAASELRLKNISNPGTGSAAHECSLVVTGGVNDIGYTAGVLSNFHTSGTPTGTADRVSLFHAQQIPPLASGFTIDNAISMKLEQQIVGTENWTIYAPDGNSAIGPITAKDSTTIPLLVRARADTDLNTVALFSVQNSAATKLFQVKANGTAGVGSDIGGCSFWVNNGAASAATIAMRVRGHASQTANVAQFGDSGGTAHVFITAATTTKRASLVLGSAAVATDATDGFLYLSSAAGAPTGTPTAYTGTVPVVFDSTNNRLMAYNGAWRGIDVPATQGDSTVAQTGATRWFNTTDQTTNYERVRAYWSSNIFNIAAEAGGTGTARPIILTGSSSSITLGSTGITLTRPSSTASAGVTAVGTMTSTSSVQSMLNLTPTINQSGTGGYAAVLVNVTETATGSGSKSLIDLQVAGSSKFRVDNAGVASATASMTAGTVPVRAAVPGSASATGTAGQIAWDANYIYVCTAANTWVRSAAATW